MTHSIVMDLDLNVSNTVISWCFWSASIVARIESFRLLRPCRRCRAYDVQSRSRPARSACDADRPMFAACQSVGPIHPRLSSEEYPAAGDRREQGAKVSERA